MNGRKLTPGLEDYLKAIYMVRQKKNCKKVRPKEISEAMGVKMSSVNSAIKKLADMGLVSYEKYGDIELTEEGKRVAELVYKKGEIIADFLSTILGLDIEEAYDYAHKLEHIFDENVVERMRCILGRRDVLLSFVSEVLKECSNALQNAREDKENC